MKRLLHSTRSLNSGSSSFKTLLKKSPLGKWRPAQDEGTDEVAEVSQAAQALRQNLAAKTDPEQALVKFADVLLHKSEEIPTLSQHVNLISQALERSRSSNVETLQLIYRAVVSSPSGADLATRLYMSLFNNAKISAPDRLRNGLMYYDMLREKRMTEEARKFIPALLRDNASAVDEHVLLELIEHTRITHPDAPSLVTIIESVRKQQPADEAVLQVVKVLCDSHLQLPGADVQLSKLVEYLFFDNSHFVYPDTTLVVFLDALLELNVREAGRKLLKVAIPRLLPSKKLENLELLLLCAIRFEDSITTGKEIVETIRAQYSEQDLVKESWDILAQWEAYSSSDLSALQRVIGAMEANNILPDSTTLSSVLRVASLNGKRSERDINEIVDYFNTDLGIDRDAASFAVLIRRSLQAVEAEEARLLFIDSTSSGADWNMDDNAYIPVLSEMLVLLCRTPVISTPTVIDTYKRVLAFTPRLSYEAQTELLDKFLDTKSLYEISLYLVQQFGETPMLEYDQYRKIYDAFYARIVSCGDYEYAWELYGVLNSTVILPYESYYPFMMKFCDLARPDAAHLMFRHLRNRAKREGLRPPGREIYIMLFNQYTKYRYEEGIRELETYFRMDLNNDMDIGIMNCMLASNAAIVDVPKMGNLWLETLGFPRGYGASNETIDIMLTHLTQQLSLEAVDDLWTEFPERFGLTPTHENVRRYVIANCYHGYYMRALEIVQAAPELYGVEITPELLETVYNWSMIESRKAQVEQYAKENHPDMWSALVAGNRLKHVLLPPNPDNDSEASLRAQAIAQIEGNSQVPQVTRRTDDLE